MARFKKFLQPKDEGKIIYGKGIIDSIVFNAVNDMPYTELYTLSSKNETSMKKSISVDFEKDGVHIEVIVKIHFSQSVNDMAFKIQEAIRHNVENMTEYHISNINVIVKGIIFDDITIDKINDETIVKETQNNNLEVVASNDKEGDNQ